MSTIAATVIMLLSICLLSKLDFLPGMSVSARAADYDVTFRIANDGDGGKITATSGNNSVTVMLEGGLNTDGNNTTITVEPYEGYCLGDIRVFHDGSEQKGVLSKKSDNTYQLLATVASYLEVVVSFEPNDGHRINITNKSTYAYYEITVKRDGKLININKNSLIAKYGDKITIKFSPLPKHIITDIALAPQISDSITNYNTYTVTFTMPDSDVTVSSSHELMFDINFASTEHGSVTANKTSSKKFETITLTVTPEDGYRLSSLKVLAGSTQITVTDNKFTMPESDVTVTAEFEKINTIQECDIRDWNYLKENADPSIATVTTENGVTTVKLNSCIIISNEFEINDENVVIDLNGYGIRGDYNKHEDNHGKLVFNLNYIMVKAGNKLTITDTYKGSNREYYITLDDNGRGYSVSNEGNESETCIKVTGGYITGLCPVNGGIVLACNYGSKVGSALTIEDGTLVGNYCDSECSVVYVNDYCTFTMNGGRIINNKAMSSSVLAAGTFIMNDGIISKNTVSNDGGGVSVEGTFVMNGGTVSGNTAGDSGGGVYVRYGTFIMTNGTISGNTATTGANIYTYSNGGEYIGKFYRLPGITVTDTDKSNGSVEKVIGKITTSDTANGSITISADDSVTVGETVYYPDGSTVTVTAKPAKGFTVKSIKYDDTVIIPADGVYSFIMPAGDVTVTAEFELIDYTITKSNVHGTVITKVNDVNSDTDTAHYGDTVTITATPDEGYGLITFAVRDADGNLIPVIDNTFTMPASNITVTAVFDAPKVPVTYIDADGTQKTVEYYTVLNESQTELTEGWYVVNSISLTVNNTLKPSGNVNIILVDDCNLFIQGLESACSLECDTYTNLCVYGQNKGTGRIKLDLKASDFSVIITGSLTINGGIWDSYITYITGTDPTKDCFTINDGNISMKAWYSNKPLEIIGGKCRINGGKIHLEGQERDARSISSEYGITLGYKKATDYIYSETFLSDSTVSIAENMAFTDGTNTYDHNTPSDTLKALNKVTLTPASAHSVTIACYKARGTVTTNADEKVFENENIFLTVTPNEGYAVKSVKYNGIKITPTEGVYNFTMPAEDVTVIAELEGIAPITYIGADGNPIQTTDYTIIKENTTEWSGTMVVQGEVTINGKNVYVIGDTNIILCDDSKLKIVNGSILGDVSKNMAVYIQTARTGTFSVSNTGDAISCFETLSFYGGNIYLHGLNGYCIFATNVIFDGGDISLTGSHGIDANNITINGGNVFSDCTNIAICANNTIYLRWTKATDSIEVNSYSGKVIFEKPMTTDGTDEYSGTLTDSSELNGKTLIPMSYNIYVTPRDTNGSTSLTANITGTGSYLYGTNAVLDAKHVEGYNFVGWFASTETNFDPLNAICTTNKWEPLVDAEASYLAVYKPLGSASLKIYGGSDFTINGESKSTEITADYPLGSKITVETNEDKFAYWQNKYGMVLSRSKSYTFTVTGADEITAVFDTVEDNKAALIFESAYGQVLLRKELASGEGSTAYIPSLPILNGYTAKGWDLDGNGLFDLSLDTIEAAISRGLNNSSKTVTIRPVYELKNKTYTITVENGTGGGTFIQNEKITVVSDPPEANMKFSHWKDGAGTVVCYNSSFEFFVDRDLKLTAVYVDDNVAVEATGMTEIIEMYNEGNNLVFVSLSTVPEGFTIVKAGVILTNDADLISNNNFDDKTATYVFGDAWSGTSYRYTLTKTNVINGETWYARGYLVYTDKNGNTHTIYSDVDSMTYQSN